MRFLAEEASLRSPSATSVRTERTSVRVEEVCDERGKERSNEKGEEQNDEKGEE